MCILGQFDSCVHWVCPKYQTDSIPALEGPVCIFRAQSLFLALGALVQPGVHVNF